MRNPADRSPTSSAVTIGPMGPLRSPFLPRVHCCGRLTLGATRREIVEHRVSHHSRGGPRWFDVGQALADDGRDFSFPVETMLRWRSLVQAYRSPSTTPSDAGDRRVLRHLEPAFRRMRPIVEPDANHPRRGRHRWRQLHRARRRLPAGNPPRPDPASGARPHRSRRLRRSATGAVHVTGIHTRQSRRKPTSLIAIPRAPEPPSPPRAPRIRDELYGELEQPEWRVDLGAPRPLRGR